MALEQAGPAARRLRRTDAAITLDPTEKGAVNYFLGMAICKLFAAKLLDAPWLLHLDVFGAQAGAVLRGRSRPDLIGENSAGQWISFESKGRISPPDASTKIKAKAQAIRCASVNRIPVSYHVAGITYFKKDVLQFYWCDPPSGSEAAPRNAIRLSMNGDLYRYHYQTLFELLGDRAVELLNSDGKSGPYCRARL